MKAGLKRVVTLDQVIELLNEVLVLDREWVERMVFERKLCNKALADHPTIQVNADVRGQGYSAGLLGFLNGLFGVDERGWGQISYTCEEGHILRFDRFKENGR